MRRRMPTRAAFAGAVALAVALVALGSIPDAPARHEEGREAALGPLDSGQDSDDPRTSASAEPRPDAADSAPDSDSARSPYEAESVEAGDQSAPQSGDEALSESISPDRLASPGATSRTSWEEPSRVNHVSIKGPADPAHAISRAALGFSDGSWLLLTPDAEGDLELDFRERIVTSATLTMLGKRSDRASIDLSRWSVYRSTSASVGTAAASTATAWASSNAGREGALAFQDGNPSTGSTGNEWAPNAVDLRPSVGLEWDSPREVASVQIFGPSDTSFDPAYSAAASLYGELIFDDGSRVKVSGIAGGDSQPTTVAFMPRVTKSVVLELHRTIPSARAGLREFRVFDAGVTPPRWPLPDGPRYTSSPPAAGTCAASSTAVGSTSNDSLALVCPTPGSTMSGTTTVVVQGKAGLSVDATAWLPTGTASGAVGSVASGVIGADGRASLRIDTSRLEHGPTSIRVVYRAAPSKAAATPLYVQLYNSGGRAFAPAKHAPSGMTLQWEDDFAAPLAVSHWGGDAEYAATKPAYWGGSTFGEAILLPPEQGAGSITTLDGGYLRIRAQPAGATKDPNGWGRRHVSGLLSSLKVGATGFAAQYGYFEARMLAPAGKGSWPAFWMMSTESTTKRAHTSASEVDAVELYGHDPTASCHTLHRWTGSSDDSDVRCLWPNGFPNWAMSWHTYGVRILPTGVDYFIDGVRVAHFDDPSHADEAHYFMLNLSLGGGYPIELGATGDIIDLYIDYVRVYT